ncbi:ribonucleases P/MRP protein subunit POP1-like [Dendronephthya gigantea]|uniref:ribonucleases P/MRP protein subunit POP1-like n=1 Tax=Dendronephthya gigantea TaxID=151771 RepID=UPI00106BC2B0|nr:ribonucleases P/MRP protein subunit POP1-like [Dendronephthya gigantea]
MAEKTQGKARKRTHFEMERSRQSPFQNPTRTGESAAVVSKAPRGINSAEFAESRALEIHNMLQALSSASKQSNKRVFQSLPRHMRRRAASHDSKRMPVRLRNAYDREALKSQEKSKEPSKQKKSRRHRRKRSNLLQEYNRRKRKHAWLETHIWHAKRFKMVEQWGYKIPCHPNDKSVRASYRAMANGCLLQDISYYQCTEVKGRQEIIIAAMKHLISSDIGLTVVGKEYLDGKYESETMLYKYDRYPYQAIGPVMCLWEQQVNPVPDMVTRLWLWSHPSCSDEVVKEIVHACNLEEPTEYIDTKPWLSEGHKEETENKANTSSPKASELTVTILHEQLARLRLIGPKSHTLLSCTLELCDWGSKNRGSRWWEVYSKGEERIKMLNEQNKSWEDMKSVSSSGVLKSGSVIALVVKDPRLGLPVRKSSVDMSAEEIYKGESVKKSMLTSISTASAISPLWDTTVRQEVKQSKMPEKDLNDHRSKQAIPGSKIDLGDDTSRIPMMLIQQPGSTANHKSGSINFGSGYDIIFPAGWSMAFWIAFVYRGARVGGTRELETCSREQGIPHFPRDFPDTHAGREFNEEQKKNGEEKYKRYPPAKRPNYKKLGMASPFAPDWKSLVNEWSERLNR